MKKVNNKWKKLVDNINERSQHDKKNKIFGNMYGYGTKYSDFMNINFHYCNKWATIAQNCRRKDSSETEVS